MRSTLQFDQVLGQGVVALEVQEVPTGPQGGSDNRGRRRTSEERSETSVVTDRHGGRKESWCGRREERDALAMVIVKWMSKDLLILLIVFVTRFSKVNIFLKQLLTDWFSELQVRPFRGKGTQEEEGNGVGGPKLRVWRAKRPEYFQNVNGPDVGG